MHSLVGRKPWNRQCGRLDPAPVPEPDENQIAERGSDEAGDEKRDDRGAETDAGLEQQHPGDERPAEDGRDGRERARGREHLAVARVGACE